MPNCCSRLSRKSQPKVDWPASSISISATVRNIAIGSLLPDSISRVDPTRSLRPLPLSRLNTTAASVEPTMAPISRPCSSGRSNSQAAARPVRPEVMATPRVAREKAGFSATRKVAVRVRMPPSSRITASARLLMTKARR